MVREGKRSFIQRGTIGEDGRLLPQSPSPPETPRGKPATLCQTSARLCPEFLLPFKNTSLSNHSWLLHRHTGGLACAQFQSGLGLLPGVHVVGLLHHQARGFQGQKDPVLRAPTCTSMLWVQEEELPISPFPGFKSPSPNFPHSRRVGVGAWCPARTVLFPG